MLGVFPLQFMIPLGIAIACATLIGNLLGANDASSARKVALFGVMATVVVSAGGLGAERCSSRSV